MPQVKNTLNLKDVKKDTQMLDEALNRLSSGLRTNPQRDEASVFQFTAFGIEQLNVRMDSTDPRARIQDVDFSDELPNLTYFKPEPVSLFEESVVKDIDSSEGWYSMHMGLGVFWKAKGYGSDNPSFKLEKYSYDDYLSTTPNRPIFIRDLNADEIKAFSEAIEQKLKAKTDASKISDEQPARTSPRLK